MNFARIYAVGILVALASSLTACGGEATLGDVGYSAQSVAMTVTPSTVSVQTNGTTTLTATVTGTVDTSVDWYVAPGEGTINQGLYTAPATTGTFTVRASSHADPSIQAEAVVTVSAP